MLNGMGRPNQKILYNLYPTYPYQLRPILVLPVEDQRKQLPLTRAKAEQNIEAKKIKAIKG